MNLFFEGQCWGSSTTLAISGGGAGPVVGLGYNENGPFSVRGVRNSETGVLLLDIVNGHVGSTTIELEPVNADSTVLRGHTGGSEVTFKRKVRHVNGKLKSALSNLTTDCALVPAPITQDGQFARAR